MTESELLERCRNGDREGQREFFTRTSQQIHSLLCRMTGNPDDAFDLVQDTYLRAFTRISQFDGRSSLATWLYRIAVTQALQSFRRTKRNRADLKDHAAELTVESGSDENIARMDVEAALATLEPTDRTMLLLKYQQGLDYRAIAEVMDCAEGTVASRLHRARGRMRRFLGTGYAAGEETVGAEHQSDGQRLE